MKEVVLCTSPAAWSVPTLSPTCLAAESALRFARVDFERTASQTAALLELLPMTDQSLPRLTLRGGSSKDEFFTGVREVLQLLERNGKSLDEALSDGQRGTSAAVIALVQHEMMPSLLYFSMGDDTVFAGLVSSVLSKQTGRRWFGPSFCSQRAAVMMRLAESHALSSMDRATAKFRAAAIALECILRYNGAVIPSASSGELKFILGSSSPSSADCFVFAAASMVFHAQFPKGSSAALMMLQRDLRSACPLLLQYAESIRSQYFDCYSGFYSLKSIPAELGIAGYDELYRAGRMRTVFLTVVFAAVYFFFANADAVVEAMQQANQAGEQGASLVDPPIQNSLQEEPQSSK